MLFTYVGKRLGQLLCPPLASVLMLGGAAMPQPANEVALLALDPDTDNLFSAMGNMLPGESETGHFRIYNGGSRGGYFYLQAASATAAIHDPQKRAESDRLLAALEMEVTLHQSSGSRLLYRGKANQLLNEGTEAEFMMGATILLGYLAPGEALELEATVKVPDWVDNSYEGTEGMFCWNFYSTQAEITKPPTGEPGPEPPSPPEEAVPPTLWKMPGATAVRPGELVAYSMGGFANPLEETAYMLTISDIVPEGLHFVSAQLPAFTGGGSATYSIEYTTSLNGLRTLESGLPASLPHTVNAPTLAGGEYITTLSVVFSEVPPGFGEGDRIALLFRLDEGMEDAGEILNHSMLFYATGDGNTVTIEGDGRAIHSGDEADGFYSGASIRVVGIGPALGAYGGRATWALANLMLTVFSCLAAAALFLYTLVKPLQQQRQARESASPDEASQPQALWKLPMLPYIASVIVCLLMLLYYFYVENILLAMVFINLRTPLFLLLAVCNLLFSIVCIRGSRKKAPEETNPPPSVPLQ